MNAFGLRHYCRNPHCRSKLSAPVDNPHKAFCTRGCHSSFHLSRCMVCESEKPSHKGKFCRRPKCRSEYRKNPPLFIFPARSPSHAQIGSETPEKPGIKTGDSSALPWRIVAGPVITATAFQLAALPIDSDTARRIDSANDWHRIRHETAWGRRAAIPIAPELSGAPDNNPALNDRLSEIPVDLSIPPFLRRVTS